MVTKIVADRNREESYVYASYFVGIDATHLRPAGVLRLKVEEYEGLIRRLMGGPAGPSWDRMWVSLEDDTLVAPGEPAPIIEQHLKMRPAPPRNGGTNRDNEEV